jgi:hypothetical protein
MGFSISHNECYKVQDDVFAIVLVGAESWKSDANDCFSGTRHHHRPAFQSLSSSHWCGGRNLQLECILLDKQGDEPMLLKIGGFSRSKSGAPLTLRPYTATHTTPKPKHASPCTCILDPARGCDIGLPVHKRCQWSKEALGETSRSPDCRSTFNFHRIGT